MEKTKVRIRAFLTRRFPKIVIEDEQNIFQLGFINSLFAMQLVMFIEKEFAIELENDDLDVANFLSINAMSALVERKRANVS